MPHQESEPVQIQEPAILIRITRLYKRATSDQALYDVTRGVWKVGLRREKAQYALSIHQGVVREVYAIEKWHRAGTTSYSAAQNIDPVRWRDRWEFTGGPADNGIRAKYIGKSVAAYFARGNANPVTYVNC